MKKEIQRERKGGILVHIFDSEGKEWKRGILEALPLDFTKPQCICAVGGGGKTTLIKKLAFELVKQKKVICLTTTKIRRPDYGRIVEKESMVLVQQGEEKEIVTVALPWTEEKMTGVSNEFQEQLIRQYEAILIEADGSKGLPTKVPNDTEPVIPKQTTCVLGIQGIDALDQPIEFVCHRKELVCEFLGKTKEERLTLEDMAKIYSSKYALQKNVEDAVFVAVIQKVDREEQRQKAVALSQLLKERGLKHIIITGNNQKQ